MSAPAMHYVSKLTFVNAEESENRKIDYWAVESSENWAVDNERGREFAKELISSMRQNNDPTLLGRVVQTITARGQYGGCETGFFTAISAVLMSGQ